MEVRVALGFSPFYPSDVRFDDLPEDMAETLTLQPSHAAPP
jgi:hypothetical protein